MSKTCAIFQYSDTILSALLTFIDTLESEKPMEQSEDVFKIWGTTEKEYLAKSMDKVHLELEIATYLKDWEDDEEIGLHLSTDNGCLPIELEDVRDLARHFAKWGVEHAREQMMKEAREVMVTTNLANRPVIYLDQLKGFQYGDKVRVIVLPKEDEK